jgi:hypothetical protein
VTSPATISPKFGYCKEKGDQRTSAKKRKMDKETTYIELESGSLPGTRRPKYQVFLMMGHPAEKCPKIAATMGIENFSASDGWISHLKRHHSLVSKKLARKSAAVDTNTLDLCYETLPKLLKGYEAWDIYNADETALFNNCLPDPNAGIERRPTI